MSTPAGPTPDELAEALRTDPVQVDVIFGNGHTEEVREGLREVVEDADFPAYVVLVPAPQGLSGNDPDRELATLLHTRIGGDAAFWVQTDPLSGTGRLVTFGDAPDESLARDTERTLVPRGGVNEGLSSAGQAARDLTMLTERGDLSAREFASFTEQEVWRDPPEWDLDHEPPMPGDYAVWTTMAFLVVAGCAWLVLRTVHQWRTSPVPPPRRVLRTKATSKPKPKPKPEPKPRPKPGPESEHPPLPGPAEVRALAERELDELAERLASAADGRLPGATRVVVDGSYDTARTVLAGAGSGAEDLDDLVGALVLTRTAARAVSHATRSRRGDPTPYRPCFFDPRHGEGQHRRRVPVADRALSVPVCSWCRNAPEKALDPMVVPVGALGRRRPWYEADTVWARTGYGAFVDDLWHPVATSQRERR